VNASIRGGRMFAAINANVHFHDFAVIFLPRGIN
jgi:hypothetical protein